MRAIHLIQKDPTLTPWPEQPGSKVYESGFWDLSIETASRLIGKEIYFHHKQTDGATFGGAITNARIEEDEPWRGRIIFTFIPSTALKGRKTSKAGWSQEMKIEE
jgi:hypothetical protein